MANVAPGVEQREERRRPSGNRITADTQGQRQDRQIPLIQDATDPSGFSCTPSRVVEENVQMRDAQKKLAKKFGKQLQNVEDKTGTALINSGVPLAYLSYVQIQTQNRRRDRKSWPDNLAEELAEALVDTNIEHVWLDKMGYPDITTLGVASGLKPYASNNGMVVVRGAFGARYRPYHFVSQCGSYLEMVVQAVMEGEEQLSALRWTATSRLWPSAEVAIGIMHGRITATSRTVRACSTLIHVLNKSIAQLQSTDSVEKDMGFSLVRRRVTCKACGEKNRVPEVVNWKAAIQGVIQVKDRVEKWISMIIHCNGGLAEYFLTHYVIGPMWTADCFAESDRVPVASLTYFLWLQSGQGGTELERNLTTLVGRRDELVVRLLSTLGSGMRPKFWYETFEKLVERVVEQTALSMSSRFGVNTQEWAHAVWFYPSPGRGFFGDLTFSPGKQLVLNALATQDETLWVDNFTAVIIEQQRSLWPVVGASLPWYFTRYQGKEIVLVPVLMSPTSVGGQMMGVHKGPIQYCLEAEVTQGGQIVMQVPVGGNIRSLSYNRSESGLFYLAFVVEDQDLNLTGLRPCHDSKNVNWCNIDPESIANPPADRHTPLQRTMFGANGFPRDYTNLYEPWMGQDNYAHLGTIDERAVYNNALTAPGAQAQALSIGWSWQPVQNQEYAASLMDQRVIFVLRAWTRPWM